MLEYLAIPAWQTPPTRLAAWVDRLTEAAGPVVVARDSSNGSWIEVGSIRVKGYVLLEDGHAAAINFELHAIDPAPASKALQAAAEALGWELHEDDDSDSDDDDDDDD